METINTNWTDENGNHQGGQSCGQYFTIAWQRGPLNEAGRNGAFLIEVLQACLDWMRQPISRIPDFISGIGFTIVFEAKSSAIDKEDLLREVFEACESQIGYYQSQARFACEENRKAIEYLSFAISYLPRNREESVRLISFAHQTLIDRRDRRANAGTLGTHQGEAE